MRAYREQHHQRDTLSSGRHDGVFFGVKALCDYFLSTRISHDGGEDSSGEHAFGFLNLPTYSFTLTPLLSIHQPIHRFPHWVAMLRLLCAPPSPCRVELGTDEQRTVCVSDI